MKVKKKLITSQIKTSSIKEWKRKGRSVEKRGVEGSG